MFQIIEKQLKMNQYCWKRPADKIANDIGVADDQLVGVLFLSGARPVNVLSERRLDPSPVG